MDQVVLKVVSVTPPQSPNCNPQLCPVDFNSSKLLANFIFDGLKHLFGGIRYSNIWLGWVVTWFPMAKLARQRKSPATGRRRENMLKFFNSEIFKYVIRMLIRCYL